MKAIITLPDYDDATSYLYHYGKKIVKFAEDRGINMVQFSNNSLLEGRITYAGACWAALSLGKACTKNSGCFIGYKVPFSFWINQKPNRSKLRGMYPTETIKISRQHH